MQDQIFYEEKQKFRQIWVLGIFYLSAIIIISIFGYGLIQQLILDKPWGNNPMSDSLLILVSLIVILFGILEIVFIEYVALITRVRKDGIYIRMICIHRKFIGFPFKDMESCESRIYSPILEYGGWGIRWSMKGKAYNISGNKGIQLVMKNGKRILIGTQKPEEFMRAVRKVYSGNK